MATKVRVSVTFEVEDDLQVRTLVRSRSFKKLVGQAVTAVAATSLDAEPNPRWLDNEGFYVSAHVHESYRGNYCDSCYEQANDEINTTT